MRPGVTGYSKPVGEPGMGGWDVSSSASWLAFLRSSIGAVPVDPVNESSNATGPTSGDNRLYFYYCYDAGHASAYTDSAAVHLNYRLDSGATKHDKFRVGTCHTTIPS